MNTHLTTPPPLSPLSMWTYNYTADDIACLDGKCNQLQKNVATLTNQITQTLESVNKICDHQDAYNERLLSIADTYKQCIVHVSATYFGIHNYKPESVCHLIGRNGNRIKELQRFYGIKINVPPIANQPNHPIKVSVVLGLDVSVSSFTIALNHICQILNEIADK